MERKLAAEPLDQALWSARERGKKATGNLNNAQLNIFKAWFFFSFPIRDYEVMNDNLREIIANSILGCQNCHARSK